MLNPALRRSELSTAGFDYRIAFSRNIGWLTEWEQQLLRSKTVAIAGAGGVGGAYALTLARLGIGGFHIADLDRFDLVNFNRQSGAFVSSIGREKTVVMSELMEGINPQLRLKRFDAGVDEANLDDFLSGADLFIDGFDFFAMEIRRRTYQRCAELGIPAIVAGPIGFGTTYLIFRPGEMTFEQYFRLNGLSEEQQYVSFALGLTPKGFHRQYLVDPSRLDLVHHRAPSTAAAIQLCAGVVGAEAVKLLLGRGKIYCAPWYHQFDAYRGKWRRAKLRFGNAGPLQSLKRRIGYRVFSELSKRAWRGDIEPRASELENILDLARWTPSVDNAQPWRFEIRSETELMIRILVEGEDKNIYDYADGRPTFFSAGMLLESLRIAASRYKRETSWTYLGKEARGDVVWHHIRIILSNNSQIAESPLCPYLTIRSVDRRSFRLNRLTIEQKASLCETLAPELQIQWSEKFEARRRIARLCSAATALRLRSREAYEVHRRILDWDQRFSAERIPIAAVGVDGATGRLMRWLMRDWRRFDFAARYFAGTIVPQIELDLLPGLFCAGYFAVSCAQPRQDEAEFLLRAGERLQRFWLTATRMGLSIQPTLAPLCFASYASRGKHSLDRHRVDQIAKKTAALFPGSILFLGRIGVPRAGTPKSRSTRRPLSELLT